eukprot:TRINITY_DN40093_c0_g1_i1.p2 TRINITY_DN40093_c0_g1~~TRINITY_DN40093_c0_g1_i1.p2  ORF type:complete len:125 (+),score=20.53 TRINITY_DN40093_c0_g1_i1:175-549(+)
MTEPLLSAESSDLSSIRIEGERGDDASFPNAAPAVGLLAASAERRLLPLAEDASEVAYWFHLEEPIDRLVENGNFVFPFAVLGFAYFLCVLWTVVAAAFATQLALALRGPLSGASSGGRRGVRS